MKIVRLVLGLLLAILVAGLSMVLISTVGAMGRASDSGSFSAGVKMQAAMLVVSLIFILALSRGRPSRYGFRIPTGAQVKAALVFGSIVAVITHVVVALVWRLLPPSSGHPAAAGLSFLQIVVTVWIVASICEEVFYRGLIQSFLAPLGSYGLKVFGVRLSLPVIVAALLFGFMHMMLLTMGADTYLVGGIVGTAIVVGLTAGYHREKSGSLIPAILIHMLFNAYGGASEYIQTLVGG
jgi:membrane protease YdiL (CAAX protease family)